LIHIRRRIRRGCGSALFRRLLLLPLSLALILLIQASAFATLPDNRAYELVSPIEKGGLSFLPNLAVTDAGGEHVVVSGGSKNALLSNGDSWMLETRTAAGWNGVQIGPSPTPGADFHEQTDVSLNAVSEGFSRFAFQTRMALDPRDTNHGMGEYVRDTPGGPFAWATGPPAPAVPVSDPSECENGAEPIYCVTNRAVFAGASSNLEDVVWGQYHPLVAPPGALAGYPADTHEHGYEVYESVAGVDQLTGLVPAGSEPECGPSGGSCVVPPCGAAMGNEGGELETFGLPSGEGFAPVRGAVSGDGSQVIFTSPDPVSYKEAPTGCQPPEIYVRADGTTTVRVSASAKPSGDPSGPQGKAYVGSSEEGGRLNTVFFISKEELTEDANTGGADEGTDLYAYTMGARSQPAGLVDLTPENNTPGPSGAAEVTFLGASTNGKLVYFTAASELTAKPNSQGQTAKPGVPNLYLYDATAGHTTFIAAGTGLAPPHTGLKYGFPPSGRLTSEVTPDGQHLVFASRERLTPYNNFGPECNGFATEGRPVRSPGKCAEVYLYTASANTLVCASCNPSGAPPVGSARLPERFVEESPANSLEPGTLPAPRALSDDGSRVFFSSPDQLTGEAPSPTTTIGPQAPLAINWEYEPNVYEYEVGGVHLIAPSAVLLTSTPSGSNVFFDTFSQLTPQDKDGSPDVYDARVGGGFPALAPPACSGTSCQGSPAPAPIFATPASVTFGGQGNFSAPSSAPAKLKTAAEVRAERLAKALKSCRSKPPHMKRSRTSCEAKARRTYGVAKKARKAGNNGRASR
jgi:hypothetical protein